MLKIRNAKGQLGVLIDGSWTQLNENYAPRSTHQGIYSDEQRMNRAAKKKRYEQNKAARANANRERNSRKK